MTAPFRIAPEHDGDDHAIEALHDLAFGPGRYARTAFRIREGAPHERDLAFVALSDERVIGSVRFTAVLVGRHPALLLGPLAVHPDWSGRGAGRALVSRGLEAARAAGHGLVVLVGDEPYYARFGFMRAPRGQILFPGPVDPDRVLVAELAPGALDRAHGPIRRSFRSLFA